MCVEERRRVVRRTECGAAPSLGKKNITQVTHARVNRSHSDRRAVRIRTDRRPRSAESGCRPSRLARPLPPHPAATTAAAARRADNPHPAPQRRSNVIPLPTRSPARYRTVLDRFPLRPAPPLPPTRTPAAPPRYGRGACTAAAAAVGPERRTTRRPSGAGPGSVVTAGRPGGKNTQ